jgi:hypothetical protein
MVIMYYGTLVLHQRIHISDKTEKTFIDILANQNHNTNYGVKKHRLLLITGCMAIAR